MNAYSTLEQYLVSIIRNSNLMERVFALSNEDYERDIYGCKGLCSYLLHRDGEYQTQVFKTPENFVIPEHTHPNVDSYEIFVSGEVAFTHSGRWMSACADKCKDVFLHTSNEIIKTTAIKVDAKDPHGGFSGKGGHVFLSIQKWLHNVKPKCVAIDYSGGTMSTKHFEDVDLGEPIHLADKNDELSWKTTATLEVTDKNILWAPPPLHIPL